MLAEFDNPRVCVPTSCIASNSYGTVTFLVLAVVITFFAGRLALALLALAAFIDSTDLHRDRPLEEPRRNLTHVSTVSTHQHCDSVPEVIGEASASLRLVRDP